MKIFVCYARVDKPFCKVFVQTIDNHDVFLDERFYAGEDWWEIILQRLEWCDVFVYLISNNSLRSQYCKSELEIALKWKKAIMPVLLDKEAEPHIPQVLARFQWADMTTTMNDSVRQYVTKSLYKIEERLNASVPQVASVGVGSVPPPYPVSADPVTHIGAASKAMQNADFDRARDILKRVSKQPMMPLQKKLVQDMMTQNEELLSEQMSQRQRDIDYRTIYEVAQNPINRQLAVNAWTDFRRRFPDYDPNNVQTILFDQRGTFPTPLKVTNAMPQRKTGKLQIQSNPSYFTDLLEFLSVHTPSKMKPFEMARYPTTNDQFDVFLRDSQGAAKRRWWSYSPHALHHHDKNLHLPEAPHGEGNHPRPASWYDSIAYCFWLTEQIGRRVFLPTMAQRRRAVQGSDNRIYPWGNKMNAALANFRDNGPRRTTPVNQFGAAASPYGIMDLVGNTWEWLVDGHNLANPYDYKANSDRLLSGGSYRSSTAELSSDYVMKQPADLTANTIGFRTIVIL